MMDRRDARMLTQMTRKHDIGDLETAHDVVGTLSKMAELVRKVGEENPYDRVLLVLARCIDARYAATAGEA